MNSIPVVILCGGIGLYIDDSGIRRNKALVEVCGEPMFIHVLNLYVKDGFRKFILATGYQKELIQEVLIGRYHSQLIDPQTHLYQVNLKGCPIEIHLIDTGLETTTGDRVKKTQPYLGEAPHFFVTYSDIVALIHPSKVHAFHEVHGKIGTLVGTPIPTRFRILGLRPGDSQVRGFASKPVIQNDLINGGFYIFKKEIFNEDFFGKGSKIILENSILETLASRGELMTYLHDGPWRYLDCERDLKPIEEIVSKK